MAAAVEEFAELGYERATLRGIATRAQASLSVLHRHFPSKSRMFVTTLVRPFVGFMEEFASTWRGQQGDPWDDDALLRSLIAGLYRTLKANRVAIEGLVMMSANGPQEILEDFRIEMAPVLSGLDEIATYEASFRTWFSAESGRTGERLVLAMAVGVVLSDGWLQVAGDDDEVIDRITRFTLYGLRQAPAAELPSGS